MRNSAIHRMTPLRLSTERLITTGLLLFAAGCQSAPTVWNRPVVPVQSIAQTQSTAATVRITDLPPRDDLQLASLQVPSDDVENAQLDLGEIETPENGQPPEPLPEDSAIPADRYPIDLPTALQLAGASNLQITLASERTREACARLDRSELLWVPTLNLGVGYTRHDGQIQATEGDVSDVSRQSLFIGGGPRIGGGPLTGQAGGPARFFVGLNPAEAYFAPLAERQSVHAAQADRQVAFNDTLLRVGATYYALVNAQVRVAIVEETIEHLRELVDLTEDFTEAGRGVAADEARARAELANIEAEKVQAETDVRVISAELARLLRLDPSVTLFAADPTVLPIDFIPAECPLPALIGQGIAARPELHRQHARIAEASARLELENWRPLVPNIYFGTSSGGFGGGPNGFYGDFDGRNDVDAIALWELENFGLGNRARQRERASQRRQELMRYDLMRDRVAADVTQAYHRVKLSAKRIEIARRQIAAAAEALPLNFRAIRGGELRPIEAQQAIGQLNEARDQYNAAVTEFNQAQLQLLRAIGLPPEPIPVAPHAVYSPTPESNRLPEPTDTDSPHEALPLANDRSVVPTSERVPISDGSTVPPTSLQLQFNR